MKHPVFHARYRCVGGAVFVSLMAATSAPALTADELWAAWQKDYTTLGYEISTGGQSRAGDTVTITDLVLTQKDSETDSEGKTIASRTQLEIPSVALTEQPDGTVLAKTSPTITAHSESRIDTSAPVSVTIRVDQQDANALVSGTPEALAYKFDAPKVTVTLVDAQTTKADGGAAPSPVAFAMTLQGIKANYATALADGLQKQASHVTIDSLSMNGSGTDDESGASYAIAATMNDMEGNNASTLPEGVDISDLGAAVAKGASVSFSGSYGTASLQISQSGDAKSMQISATSQSGTTSGAMSSDGFIYKAAAQNPHIELQKSPDPSLPVPMSADLSQISTEFSFPLAQADAAQPFSGKVTMTGLTVSDSVWALLDPNRKLPRTPADLSVDLGGMARISGDLFGPQTAPAQSAPVEIDRVDINNVHLSIAGLTLDGKGGATVDNSAGTPVPSGAVDLSLTGANALMDNLVSIGLAQQQQSMIVKMMLGLYAVQAGPDAYTSKIEMKPTGEILANGQRIR